jgi:hypothetical protein
MKPMAFFLILFILVCGIWSQFFMIQLISWRVALAGFGLPWLGFAFGCLFSRPVFRIQIHRIHMFLGLMDPDLLVRGMDPDPDPSIIKQK